MRNILLTLSFLLVFILSNSQKTEKIIDAFRNSIQAEKDGDLYRSIRILQDTGIYDEESYEINFRMGWLSYALGLNIQSSAYYHKAITINPNSIEVKLALIKPVSAIGKYDEIKKICNDIIVLDNNNYTANYQLGVIIYNEGNYKDAVVFFEKNYTLYPFDFENLIYYAWSKLKIGAFDEAENLFYKCLLFYPDSNSAKEGLKDIQFKN